jgi:outer membrane receptor for ferrienterochelin and colicins
VRPPSSPQALSTRFRFSFVTSTLAAPLLLSGAALCASAGAQDRPPPSAPQAPAEAASAPAAAAPQQVEVTGSRQSDTEQRRQSTASKIVIGREELDRFGDSTVGEVLKRLPGVTVQGAPGRGRGPRMRGLGAGYTQILMDGQRVPPGFSLESLTPEQIERIEILRAPTAETGARAIGGTINIITREGYKRRINDLRVGLGYEDGQVTPSLFWTRNDSVGALVYNVSGSVFRNRRSSAGQTLTTESTIDDDTLVRQQLETYQGLDTRLGMNLSSRLQWQLGPGRSLLLMPVLFHVQGDNRRDYTLSQSVGSEPAPYASADSAGDSRFTLARLNAQWRATLDSGLRVEANGGVSTANGRSNSLRRELDAGSSVLRTVQDRNESRDRRNSLTSKLSKLLEGDHSLVSGLELETQDRSETRVTEQDNRDPLAEFDGDAKASSLRLALYAQDEWAINPNWSAHAGLRWESIRTRGDNGDGTTPENHSRVLTPLLHAVWKADPKSRDQVRLSLTRSYKSPTLQNLVARPSLSSRYPASGSNTATSPDRAGNPDLRPELATGLDVAFERYLPQGGVLSVNVFHRRITDYIRDSVALETVSWSAQPRYVRRPQNVGRAQTQGIELEAKFRLDQVFDGAPAVELRNNLSLFRSRVATVAGPDNRLDEQPDATANIGADYRFRGTPLTLGGSVNLTPGYRTQLSDLQVRDAGRKRQFDAYALWVFNPAAQLRLLASNLDANDYLSSNRIDTGNLRTQADATTVTSTNWQLRLELKL